MNRFKVLFNNAVSEISIFLIICCMLGYTIPLRLYGEWTMVAKIFTFAGAAILFAWITWIVYMFISKKQVNEMKPKWMLTVETLSRILLLTWLYVTSSSIAAVILFGILFAWQEYKLISDIRDSAISDS